MTKTSRARYTLEFKQEAVRGPQIPDTSLSRILPKEMGQIMSETKKRKVHPPEFNAKVGLQALRGARTINEIGQEFGVHPVQVSQWKKDIQEKAGTLFEGRRGPQPVAAHSAPERLYSEIGRLKMELDWLKKKSGMSLP